MLSKIEWPLCLKMKLGQANTYAPTGMGTLFGELKIVIFLQFSVQDQWVEEIWN
jgi:hypothetical protein